MRKFTYIVIMALAVVVSCKRNGTSGLHSKVFEKNYEAPIVEGRNDSIFVDVSIEYPSSGMDKEIMDRMTYEIVHHCLRDSVANASEIEAAVDRYIDDVVENCRLECVERLQDMDEEEGYFGEIRWGDSVDGHFNGGYKDLVSYISVYWFNPGSIHGTLESKCIVMDKRDGHVVPEEELFVENYAPALGEILSANLHNSFEDESAYDAIFVKDIMPNGNYFVDEKGVSYIYGEYEIGPRILGEVVVSASWEELADLVSEDYR